MSPALGSLQQNRSNAPCALNTPVVQQHSVVAYQLDLVVLLVTPLIVKYYVYMVVCSMCSASW